MVGLTTVVTQRPSLGDKHMGGEGGKRRKAGVTNLPRISCLRPGNDHAAATAAPGVPPPQQQQQAPACQMPPGWMTDGLAAVLRKRLGMQLFNFDLICPDGNCSGPGPVPCGAEQESRYYIIDINYFPGVDKIPGFEQIFVDFLAAACAAKRNGATGAGGDSLPAAAGSSPPTPHPSSPPQPGPSLLVQPPAGSAW